MRREYTPAEYRQIVASLMREKEWMQQVIDLAKLHGWMIYHTHNSMRSEPGFPDLILLHPLKPEKGVLVRELKTVKGRLTKEQMRWLAVFAASGANTDVWRPPDWEEVVETLSA